MRKFAILSCVLVLSACGFEPLHGDAFRQHSNISENLSVIEISNIPDRDGQYLRNALVDRFYRQESLARPVYVLHVSPIKETKRDLDVTIESDATRRQLRLETRIELVEKESGEALLSRGLYAISSFNVLENEFATRVSEWTTRENALDDLARQIELQVALYMKRR